MAFEDRLVLSAAKTALFRSPRVARARGKEGRGRSAGRDRALPRLRDWASLSR
jgi:hypothetical protein